MRKYPTLKRLRAGETIEIEGALVRMASGDLAPGDMYIAERNSGPHLAFVKSIHEDGWVIPNSNIYPFDLHECVKVELV